MKQLVALGLLTALTFACISIFLPNLFDKDADREPSGPAPRNPTIEAAARRSHGPIDPRSISGESMFSPREEKCVVAGKEVRYVAAYTWCSRFRPGPGDTFLLEDVRVLFNRKPRSAEDLENLVVVNQERSARELGDVLSDLMGRASGLRARKAVFHGSKDVLDARKIVLEGGVEVCIAAAGAHDGPTILHVPELVIVFEEGVATSARGKGPVLIESPQGRIEGKGLLIERDGRRLEIEHAVRATLLAGESETNPG